MQRQVLVIRRAPRTADVPLFQYSDTTVDVPVATARRLRDEAQRNPDEEEAAFNTAQDKEQQAECLRQ